MNEHSTQFGYRAHATIGDFVRIVGPAIKQYKLLFVAIDSARGTNLAKAGTTIQDILRAIGVISHMFPGAICIRGSDMDAVIELRNVVVPFSAAYLFRDEDCVGRIPSYNLTSESSRFDRTLPFELVGAIDDSFARGYLADGVGLNYVIMDDLLSNNWTQSSDQEAKGDAPIS